jgi:hypothetical protein
MGYPPFGNLRVSQEVSGGSSGKSPRLSLRSGVVSWVDSAGAASREGVEMRNKYTLDTLVSLIIVVGLFLGLGGALNALLSEPDPTRPANQTPERALREKDLYALRGEMRILSERVRRLERLAEKPVHINYCEVCHK